MRDWVKLQEFVILLKLNKKVKLTDVSLEGKTTFQPSGKWAESFNSAAKARVSQGFKGFGN